MHTLRYRVLTQAPEIINAISGVDTGDESHSCRPFYLSTLPQIAFRLGTTLSGLVELFLEKHKNKQRQPADFAKHVALKTNAECILNEKQA